jgi:hypothetical protein
MKQKNKNLFIITLILLTFITQAHARGAKLPDIKKPPAENKPLPPTQTYPPQTGPYIDQIKALSTDSLCEKKNWSGRGVAPSGYIKGVALSFARSLCRLKTQSKISMIMSAASTGQSSTDALAYYQSVFAAVPITVNISGEEPLRALYTLGIGLGMRESSGSYCEGWDKKAGRNRPSSAAEAGAFQTSYDSMVLSPELGNLYAEYKASPERCFQDVFKVGVSCKPLDILGTGAGAEYQAFNIACPAFATEYAMTMLRLQRGHYGPINRKEAQVASACNDLLKSVQDLIDSDPYACQEI